MVTVLEAEDGRDEGYESFGNDLPENAIELEGDGCGCSFVKL